MKSIYIKKVEVTFEVTHYHINTYDIRRYGAIMGSTKEIVSKVITIDGRLGYAWTRALEMKFLVRNDYRTSYKLIGAKLLSVENAFPERHHHHGHCNINDAEMEIIDF